MPRLPSHTAPPKADENHIRHRFEAAFAKQGLREKGVTPSDIHLKIWRLQTRVFQSICDVEKIPLRPPPPNAQTEEGFLKPEFYAKDATHANLLYGELLLQQLEKFCPPSPEGGDRRRSP